MDGRTGGIVRGIMAFLTILNMILISFDVNPINIDEGVLTEAVSAVLLIGAGLWAWYKDSPLSKAGQAGHAVTKELKGKEKLTREEQKNLEYAEMKLNAKKRRSE